MIKPELFVDVIAEQGAQVSAAARDGPMDGQVPHMRRWRLSDVVAHLGGVHRWAAGIVAARDWTGTGHRRGRATGDELVSWFDEGVANLVSVLSGADFSASCPNFSPGTAKTVAFWARRQAHETTVHRWDAESASGHVSPIDSRLATDGVDEMLMVFRRTNGGQHLDAPVGLVTTDTGAGWRVTPAVRPGRVDIEFCHRPPAETGVMVAAPAQALLLALWGRIPVTDGLFRLTGRRELAVALLPGPGISAGAAAPQPRQRLQLLLRRGDEGDQRRRVPVRPPTAARPRQRQRRATLALMQSPACTSAASPCPSAPRLGRSGPALHPVPVTESVHGPAGATPTVVTRRRRGENLQSGPACEPQLAGDDQLRGSKADRALRRCGVVAGQSSQRRGIAAAGSVAQFLGSAAQLPEIGAVRR